jgi:APA family basic amino acid/polyamine antiporter
LSTENQQEHLTVSQKIGLSTAFSIVVANMIGTGVFTSLGFQIAEIDSVFALLLLWILGGLIALSGALSYGELAATMPRSGGEYHFLSQIYHPLLGFLAGWVSVLIGFSAPTALAAMAMASYAQSFMPFAYPGLFAICIVILLSLIHSFQIKIGGGFQRIVTFLKIGLIIFFIICGFFVNEPQSLTLIPVLNDWKQVFSSSFAVSLIFVSYAFSGWNASVYITDEIRDPAKNIPLSLIIGTLTVTILYFLLNFVFLYTTPLSLLEGKIEIGFISATQIFGESGGKIMSLVITLLLVSTLSAMIWIGPRVTMVMGEDYHILRFLSRKNKYNVPVIAIWTQTAITMILIMSSTFEQVLVYAGFVLNIFTLLSVVGVFILRLKRKDMSRPYKIWGYPITPLFFIILSMWTLTYLLIERTMESIFGLITVISGIFIYFIDRQSSKLK